MNLHLIPGLFSVCQYESMDTVPDEIYQSSFYTISKSEEELSIVCESQYVKDETASENDWKLMKVEGPLDFDVTGIISSLTQPLADKDISVFSISTYNTDYIMVKASQFDYAILGLKGAGFKFIKP